jgi:endonuclease/exonuclease/phosphatase family metal-dependent hydrolase
VAQASAPGRLRVATYNLENYLSTDRRVEGSYRRDYPKPESEKDALRTVVREMQADVLAVQEIGDLRYLNELQRDLGREGIVYPHTAWMEGVDRDRHLALLSRFPITRIRRHADLTFAYLGGRGEVRRGLLEVGIAAGGGELTCFVLHLKSRFTERSDDPQSAVFRAAEATAVRNRILSLAEPADPYLLLGDLNDSPSSRTLRLLLRRGETVVAHLLEAGDPRGDTWTHRQAREDVYSRFDYVLVSPGLLAAVVDGRARVIDLPETRLASDHRPVVVDLEWPWTTPEGHKKAGSTEPAEKQE